MLNDETQSNRLNRIIDFIGAYTNINPACSPHELAVLLQQKFYLRAQDAKKLAGLAEKEISIYKLNLTAMELNLTFNCNLACAYCFVHQKKPQDRMSFSTAKNAINLLLERAASDQLTVTLFGGEPLLEFKLIKQVVPYAIEAAQKRHLYINWAITTNGTLINEEILKFFAQYKINMLLSLDGGPQTHDSYRRTPGGEGTWHKIVSLIPLIKKYQPLLGARMTVSPAFAANMQADFRQLVDLGINQFIIAPAQGAKCWTKEEIEQYGVNMVKIFEDYHALKQKGVPLWIEEFEKKEAYTGWGCRAGRTSLAIAPNGDISPCSKFLGLTDEVGQHIVGNVNSDLNVNLLAPFLNPVSRQPQSCRLCSSPCTGGCYSVNFEQTGSHFTPSEENCLFWVVDREIRAMSAKIFLQQ